jgi:spore germination protein YaaH
MKYKIIPTLLALIVALPLIAGPFATAHAQDHELMVGGWIPYWNDSNGIKDAKKNLRNIDMVYPFAFTVTTQGVIKDQAGLSDKEWKSFIKTAQKKDIEVIPTVMWSDGASIHTVLSNDTLRKAHIKEIVDMVEKGKFDGVDIDYESKKSETIDYFSLFLKELKEELDDRLLVCTIEARTPPDSLYKDVPAVINYANDYKEIGKHCDRIQLMAYDQQRADIKLNSEKRGEPYMPVADVDWVEKVVKLALESFPAEKVVLGIPSYGHHYTVTVAPDWYKDYTRIGALNLPDMLDVAKEYKVKPSRNKAGEMSFSYIPKSSDLKLSKSLKIPKNTPSGNVIAARALAYANKTGETVQFRIGWYSDAEAMKDKIDLAKEYELLGVSLFKIDGEEDKKVWRYLR